MPQALIPLGPGLIEGSEALVDLLPHPRLVLPLVADLVPVVHFDALLSPLCNVSRLRNTYRLLQQVEEQLYRVDGARLRRDQQDLAAVLLLEELHVLALVGPVLHERSEEKGTYRVGDKDGPLVLVRALAIPTVGAVAAVFEEREEVLST